jgi:hypothetical protein
VLPFGLWDLVLTYPSQGFKGRSAMRVYRCYFLNERDRIEAHENIAADALDEAVNRALALLRQQPKHHKAIEIWEGPHRLYPARKRRPERSRIFVLNHR